MLKYAILLAVFAVPAFASRGGHHSSSSSHYSSHSTYRSHSSTRVYHAPRTYHHHANVTHYPGERDEHGRLERSEAAKDSFKRQHPCPSTGRSSGACPGYVIDHVRPLECGGADASYNMQWQTDAAGKAKDKTERSCR